MLSMAAQSALQAETTAATTTPRRWPTRRSGIDGSRLFSAAAATLLAYAGAGAVSRALLLEMGVRVQGGTSIIMKRLQIAAPGGSICAAASAAAAVHRAFYAVERMTLQAELTRAEVCLVRRQRFLLAAADRLVHRCSSSRRLGWGRWPMPLAAPRR